MARSTAVEKIEQKGGQKPDSKTVLAGSHSKELFFAVVGPVGAGASQAIKALQRVCKSGGYEVELIKASDLIRTWAKDNGLAFPGVGPKTLEVITELQNFGDSMREHDMAEVAKAAMREIAQRRANRTGQTYVKGEKVIPDSVKRVYLIDSIRHPAEIHLLRRTYGNAFGLIGVVCEEGVRRARILEKYFRGPEKALPETQSAVDRFMDRDSDDSNRKHGQHVTEAFYEADFFIDNTRDDPNGTKNLLDTDLSRFVSIISHDRVERPSIEETAMHHAHSARVRSACLSRQVGAALVDSDGTVVATGTNEVPAAGGGVYGERFATSSRGNDDHRCAFRAEAYCSSNREQNDIIDNLIEVLPELKKVADKIDLAARIRKTRLGGLIEFSRAVHAEMDALLSAGREGVSTVGTRLFVTTYPCHYCARHIVSAGVYEVQFIEPYPKSLARKLHSDSIEVTPSEWIPPVAKSIGAARAQMRTAQDVDKDDVKLNEPKVLFRPFVGVAPRMYVRAFEKTWQLKNKTSGEFEMRAPEWGSEWATLTVGYPELEAALAK
ncbi:MULTISPECIES: anti-phage dCTP deaminase [Mesorhizobium]|uniref:Deoxycytidylate deaminase n=1 Tax=Rhizobium loti TaxID=381 RepID=A0A6M7U209_RHILI|nr:MULTISPECIES: anti-phage dCTP deaminase [Mesorhizobium]KRB23272.1 deoxycytidylate deaminase [Mesorhizobium sp. Root172]OBQ66613.1 deoxycytidylate deaminase [Mesorhizobium loti]QKC70378.1 deoxycytidylate deaminase [Mesorhizobium loti]